jgi:hypothetical protein
MSEIVNPTNGSIMPRQVALGGATTRANLNALAVCGTTAGAVTVRRPTPRVQSSMFAVLDGDANAGTNAITIDGDGDLIDGAASTSINVANGCKIFIYDDGQWRSLSVRRVISGVPNLLEIAADAAGSGVFVPTGTGIPHVVAGVMAAAATLIVNADVNAAAGIVASKLVPPGSDTQVVLNQSNAFAGDAMCTFDTATDIFATGTSAPIVKTTTPFAELGAGTYATVGTVRTATGARVLWAQRDLGNTADLTALESDALDNLYVGTDAAQTAAKQWLSVNVFPSQALYLGIGLNIYQQFSGGLISTRVPMVGNSLANNQYGAVDGQGIMAMANANQTITGAALTRKVVRITGANTAVRTLTFPHPATDDESYVRVIWCATTGNGTTVSTGTGTTVACVATDAPHVCIFTPQGVTRIT